MIGISNQSAWRLKSDVGYYKIRINCCWFILQSINSVVYKYDNSE